jgi:ribosomal protein L34E
MRRWRAANPDKVKAANDRDNAKRLADPDYLREKREREALRLYGVTPEEYERKLAEQDGKCAICRRPPTGRPNGRARDVLEPSLHRDHDHVTRRFRGLLCSNCNTLIGLAGEDPEILFAAVEYLKKE